MLIDGTYGEGGGQILRTSVSLAALTGLSVEIADIRAGRTKPGLQPQHLAAVRAAGAICAARLTGDSVGSTRLRFEPQRAVVPGEYRFDIGTAGSAPLVAQTVLVPLARAGGACQVTVTGGTHVPHAPPADYVEAVYLPALHRAGLSARWHYPSAGFFPRGGGEVSLQIERWADPEPVSLTERGKLLELTAYVVTSGLPGHVAERGAAAVERFMNGVGRPVTCVVRELPSPGTGAAVVLAAECEQGGAGFTSLGERGKPMEKVAEQACRDFLAWWKCGAACDEHLADQLVLPMAVVPAESRWSTPAPTEHLRTVLHVTSQFLSIQYTIDEQPDGPAVVTLRGADAGAQG